MALPQSQILKLLYWYFINQKIAKGPWRCWIYSVSALFYKLYEYLSFLVLTVKTHCIYKYVFCQSCFLFDCIPSYSDILHYSYIIWPYCWVSSKWADLFVVLYWTFMSCYITHSIGSLHQVCCHRFDVIYILLNVHQYIVPMHQNVLGF